MELFQPIRRLLADSDLVVSFRSDGLGLTDLRSNVRHDIQKFYCVLDSFASSGGPERDQVGMRFSGQLNDGMIRGNVKLGLQDQNPTISLADELCNVNMTAQMQPLIENFFPGMNVSSKITIIEDLQFAMFDYPEDTPNYPEGQGEMIFGRGQLVGKAAPDWVTRIFPGLNFTRYRFSRMHNWFKKYPNGTVHNNMIFRGRPWNIYIEGDSFPDTWVNYEVGVDLLARYDSEYWSSVGQGRVPIFRSIGRVVNGKFEEQKIRYVPFHEVLYRVLVKNNVITGAYRMMLKRQRQNM